jgi:2-polyprenyl-3-methyl-5-hydroxy-6-metoxy-1,4-benzoquinol methylase
VSTDLLAEQQRYYAARANEYEQWWNRQGRYDHGRTENAEWMRERRKVEEAFDRLPVGPEALELAAGTGIWTERLARRATSVHVVDGAPEMLARNRARLGTLTSRVTYEVVDLFAWEPPREFDTVLVCFWISHVPRERLDEFLGRVARSVRPATGRLFFLDTVRESTSGALDHSLPPAGPEVQDRRLNDGREFRIVKTSLDPEEVEARFGIAGMAIQVSRTGRHFQYGIARRPS